MHLTPDQVRTLVIMNKDGEVVTPSGVTGRETAPARTATVVTGRNTVVVNGRVVQNTVTTGTVHYKPQAEINLDVTRRDVNSAQKPTTDK